jgi:hypothetical protein
MDVTLAVEVGNDDNAFFVVVVVEQPSLRVCQYKAQIARRARLAWEIRRSRENQG